MEAAVDVPRPDRAMAMPRRLEPPGALGPQAAAAPGRAGPQLVCEEPLRIQPGGDRDRTSSVEDVAGGPLHLVEGPPA